MVLTLALLLAAADPQGLYQRLEQRFANDPAAAAAIGRPAPQMREMDWLVGTWDVATHLEARGGPPETGTSVVTPVLGGTWLEIRNVFAHGTQSLNYVGYGAAEGRWISIAFDTLMNGNRATSSGWTGESIVFEGDFVILGLQAHLRQTVTRDGPDNYSAIMDERVEGRWQRLGVNYYHRRRAG